VTVRSRLLLAHAIARPASEVRSWVVLTCLIMMKHADVVPAPSCTSISVIECVPMYCVTIHEPSIPV
jgi:hypothetical protein